MEFHISAHPGELALLRRLRRWIRGETTEPWIHKANIYGEDPIALTAKYRPAIAENGERVWYFLCAPQRKHARDARISRVAGEGTWKKERTFPVEAFNADLRLIVEVGSKQSFSYIAKKKSKSERDLRLGWIQHSFLLLSTEDPEGRCLCRIFRTKRRNNHPLIPQLASLAPIPQATAASRGAVPGGGGATAASRGAVPGGGGATAASLGAVPGGGGATSASRGAVPGGGGGGATSASRGAVPGGGGATAASLGAFPGGGGATPASLGAVPGGGGGGATPAQPGAVPGGGGGATAPPAPPAASAAVPGRGGATAPRAPPAATLSPPAATPAAGTAATPSPSLPPAAATTTTAAAAAAAATAAAAAARTSPPKRWMRVLVSGSPTKSEDLSSAKRVYKMVEEDEEEGVAPPYKMVKLFDRKGWLTIDPAK